MRCGSFAVMLALCATHLCAQPASAQPAEPEQPTAEPPPPEPEKAEPPPKPVPISTPNEKKPPAKKSIEEIVEAPMTIDEGHPGFRFGSYGRVLAGSDLRGGKPEKILIVAHGPRVVEDSYLELEVSYGFRNGWGLELRPIVTLAFDGTLFHDTGDFDAQPALRNVFLDAQITRTLSAWVGSRMYRGDDIYLFDHWPLDDQNTVGAGARYATESLELGGHIGFNRLNHEFQFQQITVPNPVQGATTVDQLNRQRIVASITGAYIAEHVLDEISAKFKAHSEIHRLGSGTRERMDGTLEALPADRGFLVGAQVGLFAAPPAPSRFRRHANLFVRYANGLAAFDELAPPTSFGPELKTNRANELSVGVAAGIDHKLGNVLFGLLSRRFIDADADSTDPDDGWEYAVDLRPLAKVARDIFVGGDVSYQARFPRGLNPITLRAEDAAVFQIAPMLVYSPLGPSAYDRPQLRMIFRAAHLDDGARDLYVPADPRHDRAWVYFLGFAAEWWFNSSTYR
jgi:maltoporin